MKKRLIILFASFLLIAGMFYILMSWDFQNSNDSAIQNIQKVDKILYFGDHEIAFRAACQYNGIYVATLKNLSDQIKEEIIVIDYDSQDKNVDYSQVRKLINCNSVYFTNVVNTKIIANELMNQESYEVLISSTEGLRNMVKVYKYNQGEPDLFMIGYYAKNEDDFSDFITKLIAYE